MLLKNKELISLKSGIKSRIKSITLNAAFSLFCFLKKKNKNKDLTMLYFSFSLFMRRIAEINSQFNKFRFNSVYGLFKTSVFFRQLMTLNKIKSNNINKNIFIMNYLTKDNNINWNNFRKEKDENEKKTNNNNDYNFYNFINIIFFFYKKKISMFLNFPVFEIFWLKLRTVYYVNNWIYTTNHKRIAVNYFWFVILSGIVGMVLATVIRLEFSYPGVGVFAGDSIQYLSLASAHGVIMVFFMIMPLLFGAFANFLLPTQLGVHDVAFPRLNSAAFWFLPGGLLMLCQLVCVDRRYQRMNCFNIREVQSLLKKKFFIDLVNSHDNRILMNKSAIGLRYKTNNLNVLNNNFFNFYNYGIDFNSKIRNSYFKNSDFSENSYYFYKTNTFFFNLIVYFSKSSDYIFHLNNIFLFFLQNLNNKFSFIRINDLFLSNISVKNSFFFFMKSYSKSFYHPKFFLFYTLLNESISLLNKF